MDVVERPALDGAWEQNGRVENNAFAGFVRTGAAALRALRGSGRTPREGAGEIAHVADDKPRPARIWTRTPPKEWPMIAGFWSSLSMIACW